MRNSILLFLEHSVSVVTLIKVGVSSVGTVNIHHFDQSSISTRFIWPKVCSLLISSDLASNLNYCVDVPMLIICTNPNLNETLMKIKKQSKTSSKS